MMYLLDTNVVSELRKARSGKIDSHVKAWAIGTPPASMFLSTICILELERGTLLMQRRDVVQASLLRSWLEDHIMAAFAGRILPVDVAIARRCAAMHVPDPCSYRDSLIAATAVEHGMTVVTRNVRHFVPTGADLLNPWNA
jgi:predicted nucleic acid-binding protein